MVVQFEPHYDDRSHQFPQKIAILLVSLSTMSVGMLLAWTSPFIIKLMSDNSTNLAIKEASYLTVIPSASMGLTAPLFPMLLESMGRKKAVLLITVPQLTAWFLKSLNNIQLIYVSRVLVGVANAGFYSACPTYMSEIADPNIRGTWGKLISIFVFLGFFLINVIGTYCSMTVTSIICSFLPILHLLTFPFMPETPHYLLKKNKVEEARKSLQFLKWKNNVDEELKIVEDDIRKESLESTTWKSLFFTRHIRKGLIIIFTVRFVQFFGGLATFEVYTQYLFQEAGGSVSETTSAISFSCFLASASFVCPILVEKHGRKCLLTISCLGCGVVLMIETIYFFIDRFTEIDLSYFGWLPLTGMLCYILFCASGLTIIPLLLVSELLSTNTKGKACTLVNISTAVYELGIHSLFSWLTDTFGIHASFCFFSIVCLLGAIFSHFYMIETKGKTLQEIQDELKK